MRVRYSFNMMKGIIDIVYVVHVYRYWCEKTSGDIVPLISFSDDYALMLNISFVLRVANVFFYPFR